MKGGKYEGMLLKGFCFISLISFLIFVSN